MPQINAKQTASWVRVRLMAPKDGDCQALTEGELVLRADRFVVEDEHLVFLVGEEVAYRMERRYFRALTWFVDRPTFGEWLRLRRKQYPNSHTRWTEDEVRRLDDEIGLYGMDWQRISDRHGRTVAAVKRQAAYLGLIEAGV